MIIVLTHVSSLPYTTIGDAEKPAVIVIQEWWGVNDEVKHQAQTVADKGYQVRGNSPSFLT